PAPLPCGETTGESGSNLIDTTRALGQGEPESSGRGVYSGQGFQRTQSGSNAEPGAQSRKDSSARGPCSVRALVGERGRGPRRGRTPAALGRQEVRAQGERRPGEGVRPLRGGMGADQSLPPYPGR